MSDYAGHSTHQEMMEAIPTEKLRELAMKYCDFNYYQAVEYVMERQYNHKTHTQAYEIVMNGEKQ